MINIVVFVWDPLPDQKESIPSQKIVRYTEEHVMTHFRMLERHMTVPLKYHVFTDRALKLFGRCNQVNIGPVVYKLWDKYRNLGGCYNRLYTFSGEMINYFNNQPFICMDLDMIITGDVTDILTKEGDFIYYKMPGPDGTGSRMNCGMYKFGYPGSRSHVWDVFDSDPELAMQLSTHIPGTDQGWCNYHIELEKEQSWDISDGIYDFRLHLLEKGKTELPEDAKIIMWPGPRDPSQKEWREHFPWIEEHYR